MAEHEKESKTPAPPAEGEVRKEGKGKAAAKAPKQEKEPKVGEAQAKPVEVVDPDFKYIVRLAEADLDGKKTVEYALQGIPGVGSRTANIILSLTTLDRHRKVGKLSDEEIAKLSEAIDGFMEVVPHWMLNRQRDVETGEDMHLLSTELTTWLRDDLNRLKKIRCYRGIRHEQGKKVRGQRTSSNGRRGMALGVIRKKMEPGGAAAEGSSSGGGGKEKK